MESQAHYCRLPRYRDNPAAVAGNVPPPGCVVAGIFSGTPLVSSDVIIRAALPGELARVGDLRVTAYQADGHLSATSEYAATLRGLGSSGDGQILVAVRDGRILGTVMLQRWPRAGQVVRGPDEAEIRALAVAPDGQRKGTGRALLDAVIDLAAGQGVRHLVLCTKPDMRAAHHLYGQAGFSRLADRDWYPVPDEILLAYGLLLAARP
jgi:ribosomal protein S18 acetylase RimI-like enzyme